MPLYTPEPVVNALVGDELELQCVFAGNPTPEVTWKRRGVAVTTTTNSGGISFADFGRILKIDEVKPADAGNYECVGANGVETAPVSSSMEVVVESAPSFITAPEIDMEEAEDDEVTIECEAAGTPEPEVQMFRNGIPIDADNLPDERYEIEDDGKKLTINGLRKVNKEVFRVYFSFCLLSIEYMNE